MGSIRPDRLHQTNIQVWFSTNISHSPRPLRSPNRPTRPSLPPSRNILLAPRSRGPSNPLRVRPKVLPLHRPRALLNRPASRPSRPLHLHGLPPARLQRPVRHPANRRREVPLRQAPQRRPRPPAPLPLRGPCARECPRYHRRRVRPRQNFHFHRHQLYSWLVQKRSADPACYHVQSGPRHLRLLRLGQYRQVRLPCRAGRPFVFVKLSRRPERRP